MRDILCPSVIGRDSEIADLTGALQDAVRSRGSAYFLVGEAGIGKSRLVREATERARSEQLPVLLGQATQSSETVAFRPVTEALFSFFRDEDFPAVPELEPFRGSLARLVPEWRDGKGGVADESIVVLAEAILRLLRVVGRNGGCLLVLEDLHWADPETLSIVEYLCENIASEPVMLLCTTRSEEPGPAADLVDVLAARRAAAVTSLKRLDPADTVAMGCACLSASELPASVQSLLAASADGLPFFVEELLAGAVNSGVLVQDGDDWVVRGQVEPQVPRTFVDSVHRRLASLGEAAQILVTAAVLGRRFDWTLLCDVAGEPKEVVLGALRAGVDAQLLVAEPGTTGSFHFRHALTRDTVVGRLLPVERAELARRAVDAILAAHPELPGEWCDLAARLAEPAGDPRAATLLIESGRRSLARGALASAEDAFDQARALAGDLAVKADATEALCETLALAGKIDPALELGLDLASALDAIAAPPQRLGLVHSRLAWVAAAGARWDVAEQHLELARHHAAQATEPALMARLDLIAAQIAFGRGDLERADELARAALAEAEQLGLHDLTCEALWVIGHCARVSDVDLAEQAYLQAAAVAARHGLEVMRIRALFELGTIDFLKLRPPDHLKAARDLASATGALATVAQIDLHLAAWSTFLFDSEAAIASARRASEAARRLRMQELRALSLVAEATGHGRLGRRDQMESLVAEALDLAGDEVSVAALVWGHCRAEFSLIDEDRQRGLRELDTMMDVLRTLATSPTLPQRGLWALVRAVENVDGQSACAEVRASGISQHLNLGFLNYAEAVLAGRAGRVDQAHESFAAGADVLGNLTWYRHLAQRLVAEAAIADGWGDPATWLLEALTQFEEYQQERLMAACRSLLKKAGAPVPRRRAESRIPPQLRERGVTEREAEVLALLAEGLGNGEIAGRLFLSPRTVERHIANMTAKLDLRTRNELVAFAARTGR